MNLQKQMNELSPSLSRSCIIYLLNSLRAIVRHAVVFGTLFYICSIIFTKVVFSNWFLLATFKTQILKILGLLEDSGKLEDFIYALNLEIVYQ